MRAAAFLTLVFGAFGLFGAWGWLCSWWLGVAILFLPGFIAARALLDDDERRGPGVIAWALVLSVALVNLSALFAVALAGGRLAAVAQGVAISCVALGAWGLSHARAGAKPALERENFVAWGAAAASVVALLPVVLRFAGGGIDDWWDLAYVRALADRSVLDFREPLFGTEAVHPRFSWSAWLTVQALSLSLGAGDPVDFQVGLLAPVVCIASVSAAAALARAVFGRRASARSCLAVLMVPVWLYGTDAFPYFTRLHQDKIAAALVFVPLLLASFLRYVERPTGRHLALFAAATSAACAVHTLVFGVGLIGVAACALVALSRGDNVEQIESASPLEFGPREFAAAGAVMAVVLLLPAWQAWSLREWFDGQGIGLHAPDNPVVRAHLALGRLLAPGRPYMVVNPAAVFGPIGLLALVGAILAARRRVRGDAYLAVLTGIAILLLFVPPVAAAAGGAVVPWMLYRIGWLIPQPLLLARAAPWRWMGSGGRHARLGTVIGYAVLAAALAAPTAADQIRRGMREHPTLAEPRPRGTTLQVYRFLDEAPLQGAVLAPTGFSNLVTAFTGRSVVAFSERGTVVFSRTEALAYERLRDRAEFLSCTADAATRRRIGERYGVAYAVFRRRYVTNGDERAWLERATTEGVLSASDYRTPVGCAATREDLARGVPPDWRIVFENDDYFVVETAGVRVSAVVDGNDAGGWLNAFHLDAPDVLGDVVPLATSAGYPAGVLRLDPLPLGWGVSDDLVWVGGGATWDDGPFEVSVTVGMSSPCTVAGVELVPFLERERREVISIAVDGEVRTLVARDGVPLRIALEPRQRGSVRVEVRSLLGLSFGFADVKLLGQPSSCAGGWQPLGGPALATGEAAIGERLDLAATFPLSARMAVGAAHARAEAGRSEDAAALLRRALARDAGSAVAWIELGLLEDASGRLDAATRAYRRARAADSNNAWAHGCLAWAGLRAGRPLQALYHSARALRLDSRYADALTIAALAADRIGLHRWAGAALEKAIGMAPRRGWPYFERVRQLAAEGRLDEGRKLLGRYRRLVPDDAAAAELLQSLSRGRGNES